jgi:hypothetical protein
MIDFLHVLLATTVLLLWLVIVVGWLMTCGHGESRATPGRGKVPPQPHDPSPSIARRQKAAA